jgi:hypothetical protein
LNKDLPAGTDEGSLPDGRKIQNIFSTSQHSICEGSSWQVIPDHHKHVIPENMLFACFPGPNLIDHSILLRSNAKIEIPDKIAIGALSRMTWLWGFIGTGGMTFVIYLLSFIVHHS